MVRNLGRLTKLSSVLFVVTLASSASAQVEGSGSAACVPDCRAGYFCHEGECLSRCNPLCEGGKTCSNEGKCVADMSVAPPAPQVAPAPVQDAPVFYPQLDRRTERELLREQRQLLREQKREERAQIRAERALERQKRREEQQRALDKDGYHGRFYGGANVTLEGKGAADDNAYLTKVQMGVDAGVEFRMNMAFGLGPSLRYQRVSYRNTRILDLAVNPTIHFPMGMVEVVLPISFGLALGWDDSSGVGSGPFATDGAGFVIGVTPSLIFWPTRSVGVYANVGLSGHLMYMGYSNQFYTSSAGAGITLAY